MKVPETQTIPSKRVCLSGARALHLGGTFAVQWYNGQQEGVRQSWLLRNNALLVVLAGTVHVTFGAKTYTVAEEQMALLRKDILVTYSADLPPSPDDTISVMLICFPDEILKHFVKAAHVSVRSPRQSLAVTMAPADSRVLNFLVSLTPYFFEAGPNGEYLTRIKLLELLFNLTQANSIVLPQLLNLRSHFRHDITATVEENLMSPLSLPQLATLSGRSLSSFKRDFLATYNVPPSTWLRRKRLEKARELFRSTSMTVTDVCYTLGFENLAHFSRLFKSHFGHSPSQSRRKTLPAA